MTVERPKAMRDYSRLPTLVLNEIFGYLSVKERVRCKSVCRSWREEIELREAKSDTLVLHLGPYLWNQRWSETNNGGLMKFENSFQVKRLTFLEHPLTRPLLEKTKKLAIVNFHKHFEDPELMRSKVHPYLSYLKHCGIEVLEIQNFVLKGTLTFDLPVLRTLVLKQSDSIDKLVLNCPSLELLFYDWEVKEIILRNVKKLKRLICYGWPPKASSGTLESLESLNLFTARGERVSDRLLDGMPKLKRLVLYSSNPRADLESLRNQQERYS